MCNKHIKLSTIISGWTKEEALDSLIRKSGYHGIIDQKLLNSISLERYQSEKLTVSYTDYLKARK